MNSSRNDTTGSHDMGSPRDLRSPLSGFTNVTPSTGKTTCPRLCPSTEPSAANERATTPSVHTGKGKVSSIGAPSSVRACRGCISPVARPIGLSVATRRCGASAVSRAQSPPSKEHNSSADVESKTRQSQS